MTDYNNILRSITEYKITNKKGYEESNVYPIVGEIIRKLTKL